MTGELKFVIFRQRERPRFWAATDDWDVGDVFAEADTIPKLHERVRARLEDGRRAGWLAENFGLNAVPKVVFRRAVRADHRALDQNLEHLDGLVEEARRALPEVVRENKDVLDSLG